MGKLFLLAALPFTLSIFADEEVAVLRKSKVPEKQQEGIVVNSLTSAAVKSTNGWNLFADLLYWHADIGNADWAYKDAVIGAGEVLPHLVRGKNYAFSFKWDWGFRVGVGKNLEKDRWDTALYYTWFQAKNSAVIGALENQESVIFLPNQQTENTNITNAKLSWSIHYSMFDWDLGKSFFVSNDLSLRPHVGAKGGWIDQTRDQSYVIFSEQQAAQFPGNAKFMNDYWGVGPAAGLATGWRLGQSGSHRFSLVTDFSGAFMYGHFANSFRSTFTNEAGELQADAKISHLNRNLASVMLRGIMGFAWDAPINKDRAHFTFNAGYEFQYWFRQNQFPLIISMLSDQVQYSRYDSDLKLQGLTFEFRFDF